ncbi:hypothetical protein D3C76_1783490 [compost metagenome]
MVPLLKPGNELIRIGCLSSAFDMVIIKGNCSEGYILANCSRKQVIMLRNIGIKVLYFRSSVNLLIKNRY